ncbi:hypothetical protein [Ureibacillus sp. FSL E2-3493]|uniref:hypothetical protein n=1 Tax=Ureibacillus sp. FSL E2-3493 TaxID=2921367 RepID=UPI003119D9D9
MNPSKKDVHDVYLKYFGHVVKGSIYYDFQPTYMQTEILFGESYAILEKYNQRDLDLDTTFHYEVLYVSDEGLILKKFYRKKLENIKSLESHPLFQSAIWMIEERTSEYINTENIIQIVSKDVYAAKVPTNNSTYHYLMKKSELFEPFFKDLYNEMESYYNGDKRHSIEKWDFAEFLQTEHGVQFEHSEGVDIILSNCLGMMRKLNITKEAMAEYFCKYIL